MKSIHRIFLFTKRNFKEIIRDPLSLIFLFAMPLVMLILFYLIFHKATSQFELQYFVPGMIAFSGAFISLFSGILIATDRSSSFLTRLYTTPFMAYEFILGYAFAMIPLGLIQTCSLYLVGMIFDISILSWNVLLVILASILITILFIGFGIFFGAMCNEKSVGGLCSILIMGQSVLSGMWFPVEGLSKGFVTFMEVLPFKNSVLILQNIMNGSGNVLIPIVIILAYIVAIYIVSISIYSYKMKRK